MTSAEHCYAETKYTERYRELLNQQQSDYFTRRKNELEAALASYTRAEDEADELIEQYCKLDKVAIIQMYEQDTLSGEPVCE